MDKKLTMQQHINDTVKHIENFKTEKTRLSVLIESDEARKFEVEKHLEALKNELRAIEENIKNNTEQKMRYEQAIDKAELTYMKILDSCQTLSCFLNKESEVLSQSDSTTKMKQSDSISSTKLKPKQSIVR